jgi:hypothetical protein
MTQSLCRFVQILKGSIGFTAQGESPTLHANSLATLGASLNMRYRHLKNQHVCLPSRGQCIGTPNNEMKHRGCGTWQPVVELRVVAWSWK